MPPALGRRALNNASAAQSPANLQQSTANVNNERIAIRLRLSVNAIKLCSNMSGTPSLQLSCLASYNINRRAEKTKNA